MLLELLMSLVHIRQCTLRTHPENGRYVKKMNNWMKVKQWNTYLLFASPYPFQLKQATRHSGNAHEPWFNGGAVGTAGIIDMSCRSLWLYENVISHQLTNNQTQTSRLIDESKQGHALGHQLEAHHLCHGYQCHLGPVEMDHSPSQLCASKAT